MSEHDPINHPKHYTSHPSGLECITITEHMGFNLGNALKYIWRADEKGSALEDLRKAKWYIEREIAKREKTKDVAPVDGVHLGASGFVATDFKLGGAMKFDAGGAGFGASVASADTSAPATVGGLLDKARATSAEWIKHEGDTMPIPGKCFIAIRLRNGNVHRTRLARGLIWTIGGFDSEIIEYQIESCPTPSDLVGWGGGERPVPANARIEYTTRRGSEAVNRAGDLIWKHRNIASDIVRYRILSLD